MSEGDLWFASGVQSGFESGVSHATAFAELMTRFFLAELSFGVGASAWASAGTKNEVFWGALGSEIPKLEKWLSER